MLSDATKTNLRRKSEYVDKVQMHDGAPLFSYIDISPTELCARKCVFCPRVDSAVYPNQRLHMPRDLAVKIGTELRRLDFKGTVTFCGFGEPLLHPDLAGLVNQFQCRVEVVTSGDTLDARKVVDFYNAGVDYFVVSLYDGPFQIDKFNKIFEDAGAGEDKYMLRDRWHTEEDGFGLKLTNRAGTVTVGNQEPVDLTHACHYLAYMMQLDWNGDVLLCPQDWKKVIKYGNIAHQSLAEIWKSPALRKRRMQLIHGRRDRVSPCNNCNTDGTLHGYAHVPLWLKENSDAQI